MNDSLNEKEIQKKVRREAFKRNWLYLDKALWE